MAKKKEESPTKPVKKKENQNYYDLIQPKLPQISEYKARNLSNESISNHLGVTYREFQDYVHKFKELRDALIVGEDMIVDKAESELYNLAFRRGNVQALQFILKKLAPDKWGDIKADKGPELPEIKIEFKDARKEKEYFEELVADIAHLAKDEKVEKKVS